MTFYLIKILVTAVLVASISELSKRFSFLASVLASIPLTSFLAFLWIYIERKNVEEVATLSIEVFYLVIPSLAFFVILPILLRYGFGFYMSLVIDSALTFLTYLAYLKVFRNFRFFPL